MKFPNLIIILFFSMTAFAQDLPKTTTEDPDKPVGTIVQPTPEQKQSAKEIKAKAKANLSPSEQMAASNKVVSTKNSNTSGGHRSEHLFGLHADLNVPHILNFGVDYWHSSRWFSASVNMGGYSENDLGKYNKDAAGGKIKLSNQEAVLRVHPFTGSFYVGLTYGQHKIDGTISRTMTSTAPAGSATGDINIDLSANYLTPHIGWMIVWDFGLSLGFDIGYMSPSNVKYTYKDRIYNLSGGITESDIRNSDDYKKARGDVEKNVLDIGNKSIPYVALVRIGWMF